MPMLNGCVMQLRGRSPDATAGHGRRCPAMNQPKQPDDVPDEGVSPANNPTGTTPHGTPEGQADEKSKALPNSDREATETAAMQISRAAIDSRAASGRPGGP